MLAGLWSRFVRLVTPSPPPAGYRVFTTDFDVEVRGERLSEVIGRRESPDFGDYVSQFERAMAQWRGLAEPAAAEFVNLVKAGSGGPELGSTIACLLIDHSGSMRGQPSILAASLASIVADCWRKLGIRYENSWLHDPVLEGRAPEETIDPDRPARQSWTPLRASAYCLSVCGRHLFRRRPSSIRNLMREELLKENVDGEALMWAADRLLKRPEKRKLLVVVSDGAPVDDATLAANGPDILDRHLKEVIAALRPGSDIRLGAIGLGHNVSRYYAEGIVVSSPDDLTDRVLTFLAGLFEDPPASPWPRRSFP